MYCLTNICYVCLEMKNNLISSVDSSMSVNKELLDIVGYCAHNLAWWKTKRIILICEECCSRLHDTYQFLQMWHKNSAILQDYMDRINDTAIANTENEAERLIHLKDVKQVKCEIKDEQIYTDEYEPIIEETQDVFVNIEDSLIIEENTWKKEETDDREEYPMDNNSTDSMNNKSDTEISVNSNTRITNTISNTENEAELVHLKDANKVKCELKEEQIHTDDCEPIIEDFDDSLIIEEHTWKEEEPDDREDYPMDNNFTESVNNESDSEISVNSNAHITNTPANKPYTCSTCSKSFNTKTLLKRHAIIHTGEKPYKCDRCDKYFNLNGNLLKHMRTHSGEKPYKCDRCDKCFGQNQHLVYHMRTHTGEKPYKCDKCEKYFSQQSALVQHMRIHTGEKPHKCARCDKCFNRKTHLLSHMRTHTGEKSHK